MRQLRIALLWFLALAAAVGPTSSSRRPRLGRPQPFVQLLWGAQGGAQSADAAAPVAARGLAN